MTEYDADLVVVGAGPIGLWAAFCAGFRGLSVVVVDSHGEVGGQVRALYPNKPILDVAGLVSVTGDALVDALVTQAARFEPRYVLGRRVVDLRPLGTPAGLHLGLDDGTALAARAVVLATGVGGIEPRPVPVGHEWLGRGLTYAVHEPVMAAGHDVVVVGGGDTAIDWAIELVPYAASVTVVHRRRQFRAHAASLQRAQDLGARLLTDAELILVDGDDRVRSVTVQLRSGERAVLPADTLVGALGLLSDIGELATWQLEMHGRQVVVDSAMHSSLARVFAVGDASWHPGKVELLTTGFGEAATAVNNAAVLIDPAAELDPGHSTDRAVLAVPERTP